MYQDTIIRPLTAEDAKAFNVVFNSESYYHEMYLIRTQINDSLSKALDIILKSKGLVLGTKVEVDGLIKNYKAIDEAQSVRMRELEKEAKKFKRRKNFWKVTTGIASGAAIFIAIFK